MTAPKLRFKDFDEDWTAKKLSQVANLTSSKRVHLSDYVSEGIPFFRGKEITELKSGIFPKDILYISKKQYEDFKEKFGAPQNNEILMTAVGTLANTYLINTDFEFYFKDGNLIWFKDINADPNFLMILLDARKNDVLASAIGSTQKALTIANLNKLIFNFPSKEEQTKIASFLSNVDEKISQLTQKHALLSQYKQGMMQKLFSQQIRFKADDGSEFGEWRNKKVIDLFVEIKDKVLNQDIETYSITAGKGFVSQAEKFGRDISGQQNSNYIVLKPQDFSYNKGNSKTYKYGCVYLNEFDYSIAVPNVFISFRAKNINEVNQKFYAKLFEYHYLDKHLRLLISSSARMDGLLNVSKDGFFEINVPYPCLEEQTKIANFLSAIDQKVEVVAHQIEQAKTWKKGLLQQMFV